MDERRRSSLVGGLLLVLLGIFFLVGQFVPGLARVVSWPLIVIGVGVLVLIIGLVTRAPAMAVPACVVGGIGCLLYWQNMTGNWESWAYAWTLIPGFVGLGTVLMGLLKGERSVLAAGAWLILLSLVLLAIFASFLGGFNLLGIYWPLLLVALGLLLLAQTLFRRRGSA